MLSGMLKIFSFITSSHDHAPRKFPIINENDPGLLDYHKWLNGCLKNLSHYKKQDHNISRKVDYEQKCGKIYSSFVLYITIRYRDTRCFTSKIEPYALLGGAQDPTKPLFQRTIISNLYFKVENDKKKNLNRFGSYAESSILCYIVYLYYI